MKKLISISCTFFLVLSLLSGCNSAKSETFTGEATGFGGNVKVSITVKDNTIVDCTIEADGETPSIGGAHIQELKESIITNNGKIDTISGATVTSTAVKNALQKAMLESGLIEASDYAMKDGTYTGSAHGFSCIDYITIETTITDGKIANLKLIDNFQMDKDSYENRYLAEGAFDLLSPDIISLNSVALDAITGATGSSNGIKSAITNSLMQAYMANGLSEEEAELAITMNNSTKKEKESGEVVLKGYDVIVVGAGAAGTTASLTALSNGAKVINIEKTFRWGGQSMMTGGPKAYNPNTTEEEAQVIFNEYQMTLNMFKLGEDAKWNDKDYQSAHSEEYFDVNEDAYKAVIPASGKGISQLINAGIEFTPGVDLSSLGDLSDLDIGAAMAGAAMAKSLTTKDVESFSSTGSGQSLSYKMAEEGYSNAYNYFINNGGEALLQVTVKELLTDNNGTICGVLGYGADGKTYKIYGDSVILATGGYGGNEEMVSKYTAGGEDWIYYGWQGNDGDGIQMALEAGADDTSLYAYPMSHQRMGFEFLRDFEVQTTQDGKLWSPNDIPVVMAVNNDAVFITDDGVPFNAEQEGLMGDFSGSMGTYHLGSTYYVIYSEEQIQNYITNGFASTKMGFQNVGEGVPVNMPLGDWMNTVLDTIESKGWLWRVNSLEEADKVAGLPSGSFAKAYEQDVTQGSMNTSQSNGFIVMKCTGLSISSCGGITVNENMQVIKADGTAIDNLYVAGNDGFGNIMATGSEYPIGGDAGMFVIGSGYIAGDNASK